MKWIEKDFIFNLLFHKFNRFGLPELSAIAIGIQEIRVHLIARIDFGWKENEIQQIELSITLFIGNCQLNVFNWYNFSEKC